MRNTLAFLSILLGLQLLSGCKADPEPHLTADQRLAQGAVADPALATSIMADMARELSVFIPPGAPVVVRADRSKVLSDALRESLAARGYALQVASSQADKAVPLEIWSATVDGHVLIRLSTPSQRLSKVYRHARMTQDGMQGSTGSDSAVAAGPLLVETIQAGAGS